MKVQLWHRNVRDTVVILEEGSLPHPLCPMCDIMEPWISLNVFQKSTAHYKKGTERKRQRLVAKEARVVTSMAFSAYGIPLEVVPSFKYLGRLLSAADDDWSSVIRNLTKAQVVWWIMSSILSREGARPQVSVFFFKSVVQSVLLFSE